MDTLQTMARATLAAIMGVAAVFSVRSVQADVAWSVFVDQTAQSSPASEARSLRAIAVNPQSTHLYASYINGTSSHAVKDYDAAVGSGTYGDLLDTFSTSTGTAAAKAITADDRGYIYTGRPDDNSGQIRIFDANDSYERLASVERDANVWGHDKTVNGIKVVESGGDYLLYTTGASSSSGFVNRWSVTDPTSPTVDISFGVDGRIDLTTITGAANATYLRGIDVGADGTLFTASLDNGYVHRIEANLDSAISASVAKAHDVALFGNRLYVVTYDGQNSRIHVLDALTLSSIEVWDPLADMGLSRGTSGGFSGIEIDKDGRIYVSDQVYDSTSGTLSDRILVSTVIPEPASLALLGLGGLLILRRRHTLA